MKRNIEVHGHPVSVELKGDLLDFLLDNKEKKAVKRAFRSACSMIRLNLQLAVRPMPDDLDQDYETALVLNDLRRRVDALEAQAACLKDIQAPDKEKQAREGDWD